MFKSTWNIIKTTFSNFMEKKVFKLSAALAYYTIFSLPALLLIVIWITQLFMRDNSVEAAVYSQIGGFVGEDAAKQVEQTIKNAALSSETTVATIIGIFTLVFGATTVFSEMQDSLNAIWNLRAKAKKGKGLVKLILTRLVSFSMVVTLGFLLLVSLFVSSVIDVFMQALTDRFPDVTVVLAYIINLLITLIVTSALFAIIFKVLPDAHIKWRDVRVGALVTGILFIIGKFLIGLYLGQNKMSSAYGAAGSVVLILLWVYYSATILYLGATFTHVYAKARGRDITPSKYAVFVQQTEVESKKPVSEQPLEKRKVRSPENKG